jgi:gamma-glutamyltranspeptidase/glutathione hydrolase
MQNLKMSSFLCSAFLLSVLISACCHSPAPAQKAAVVLAAEERPRTDHVEATGAKYAVSTQGKYSTDAAHAILAQGGNLIDAAVASSFVLAVERPQSTGLTGGGFLMYREASSGKIYAVDFRERAPLKALEKMFLGKDGKPDPHLSRDSIFASGVPGLTAGLVEIHQRFGKLSLAQVIQPAIDLADKGFPVYHTLARALDARADSLLADPYAKGIFGRADGKILKESDLLVQKDLAQTLRQIAKSGRKGFYEGPVAKKFLAYFKNKQGLITNQDFKAYKVHWREPVRGTYKGYDIVSMPPPSSGGVHVVQFLNFLENDGLNSLGAQSVSAIHLEAASLQSAFTDRAKYMGDPDFVKVPVKGLTDKKYAQARRQEVSLDKARHVADVTAGNPLPYESSETTHFSMMDDQGNMIASTQTINGWMGSGLVVPGTGLVLNNEMDDFSALEDTQNMFGAVGGKQNSVQAEKTPLSSMSPTLVLKDNKPVLAVGAPGGTRIISCTAETILNVLEFKMPLYEAVSSLRYHHQWRPDVLTIDPPGPGPAVIQELEKKGYKVEIKPIGCHVMAVSAEDGLFRGVADPRDIGTSYAE